MRIALVLDHFDPRRGGVEQWTAQFASQATALGHQVHVVARSFSPAVRQLPVTCHAIDPGGSRIAFAAEVEQYLRKFAPDVVHDTGAGWYCQVFQPHGGSRTASFERNLYLMPRWMRPLKRLAAKGLPRYREFQTLSARQYTDDGRLLIALSNMVADDFARYHSVRNEQIRVIYNGVDTVRFTPAARDLHRETVRAQLGISRDEVLVLIVAHNLALKGVPALIRATATLAAEQLPVRLVVAGGRPSPRDRWIVERLKMGDRVTFAGPQDDPVPLYAAADLYVQPTLYDPCSLVVLEAWACGLPVVTSRFNGAAELMRPGVEGYVVNDPMNHEELAERMRPCFDGEHRAALGGAARSLALAHPFKDNCEQILATYAEVADRRRQAA